MSDEQHDIEERMVPRMSAEPVITSQAPAPDRAIRLQDLKSEAESCGAALIMLIQSATELCELHEKLEGMYGDDTISTTAEGVPVDILVRDVLDRKRLSFTHAFQLVNERVDSLGAAADLLRRMAVAKERFAPPTPAAREVPIDDGHSWPVIGQQTDVAMPSGDEDSSADVVAKMLEDLRRTQNTTVPEPSKVRRGWFSRR